MQFCTKLVIYNMTRINIKHIFTGLLMSLVLPGYAQQNLSLKDALTYALENSNLMTQARIDIENGYNQVAEARASALPQIQATAQLTNNVKVTSFVLPASFMGGPEGEFIAIRAGQTWGSVLQVTLSQQIYNQQLFAGLKAAKGSAELYKLAAEVAEENVLQQVAAAYYQVVITRQNTVVLDANIKRVSELETILQSQFDAGLVRKVDLDRVRVNKANLESQKSELLNGIQQVENLLKYYMGMPVNTPISIAQEAFAELEQFAGVVTNNEQFDINQLLSYQALKKQEELLELNVKVKKAEYVPYLYLSGYYTYNTSSNKFNLYTDKALNYDMSAFSLNLAIPIFDGLAKHARIKTAKANLERTRSDIRNTENAMQMAYNNATFQIQNSLKTISAQQLNKELAQEVYDMTNANYQNGLATLTDLINAEAELVTAQNAYNDALLKLKVAQIELLKSNGKIGTLLN